MNTPLVSIICATYNHVPYIRQCLEGFMMQQTTFPFEVLIHDDASTDGTTEIVQEYERKYPDIIKPVYQKENQYSKGIRIFPTYVYPKSKGKYYALCEGDDYWTDPYKLQKQVDFLEAHPDYSLVYTEYQIYTQCNGTFTKPGRKIYEGNVYKYILRQKVRCQTLTVCFRREVKDHIPQMPADCFKGDLALFLTASLMGKFKYLPDVTSVYRVLPQSASHFLTKREADEFHSSLYKLVIFFCRKYPLPHKSDNNHIIKKAYYKITLANLSANEYSKMAEVRFMFFPFLPFNRTMYCLLCKNRHLFHLFAAIEARKKE